ncbi:MAG: putative DNA binding domain-containing protein [Chitinophagaceae bacterium]|nr:putative DNA binding domain-containing protein [Chitinophagaceae bacterium]
MKETQYIEKKKLDVVLGKTANWKELAKDCVCFANSRGGVIFIGIANGETLPPAVQIIEKDLPFRIKKRLAENSVNVGVNVSIKTAANGGEYIEVEVLFSASTIAATTDGKYYYRNDDTCMPLLPDELSRLFTDKPSFIWETRKSKVPVAATDPAKLLAFQQDIQQSTRVSQHIKQKSVDELLDHYFFAEDGVLTNLGVLWLGKRTDRARLLYAPTIHFLKFDEREQKVNKLLWEDHSLNPKELLEAIWTEIPDWKEGVDVADGMFRKFVPNYEEEVIRELMANALVHRPYTTRGDIFINLYADRLEVVNPGLFPIGVTPANVLHKNLRRNPYLAQVFYDLHLMDKEGSGIDKMYQVLLSNAKQAPIPYQGDDYVQFTIQKCISKPDIVSLINRATAEFALNTKELISLGLIAQHNSISAIGFSKELNLPDTSNVVNYWLGRLLDFGLVVSKGKTKGTEYLVNPEFLKKARFKGKTNLKRIENHRLEELIYQDLNIYDDSLIKDIHKRIGEEIPLRKIKFMIDKMDGAGKLKKSGANRWTKYALNKKP